MYSQMKSLPLMIVALPSIKITIRDARLAAGTAMTVRVRDDGGADDIPRRDGNVRGHDALLPSSHGRILGPRPRGLWSPFSVRTKGGDFEEAKSKVDDRLAVVAGQAAEGRQRVGQSSQTPRRKLFPRASSETRLI